MISSLVGSAPQTGGFELRTGCQLGHLLPFVPFLSRVDFFARWFHVFTRSSQTAELRAFWCNSITPGISLNCLASSLIKTVSKLVLIEPTTVDQDSVMVTWFNCFQWVVFRIFKIRVLLLLTKSLAVFWFSLFHVLACKFALIHTHWQGAVRKLVP